jgi:hypothetical protein
MSRWARGLVIGLTAVSAVALASAATAANESAAPAPLVQTVVLDGQIVILPNQGNDNNGKLDLLENLAVDCLPGSIVVASKVERANLGKTLSITAPAGQVVLAVSVKSGTGNVTTMVFGPNTASVTTTKEISNYVIVYCTPPRVDDSEPICILTGSGLNGSGDKYIQVTVQDPQSGIQSIVIDVADNASIVIAPDPYAGTLAPVLITATKIVPTEGSFVQLTVTNGQGLSLTCDPPVPALRAKLSRGWAWRPS